jgi:hypothetical protein
MPQSPYLSPLVLSLAVSLTAACIQPEYPDEFDDSLGPLLGAEGGVIAFSDAAAMSTSAVTAQNPTNPFNPLKPDAGTTLPAAIDAGTNISDATLTPVDSGPRRDAQLPVDSGSGEVTADATTMPSGDGPSSCTITASTDASDTLFYAGKYGCAVWISSAANKLVKSFFVATRVSNRTGLPTYKSESSGAAVDVVAGATLGSPKQHSYTWTLTDAQGGKIAPGKYALKVEMHSSNGVTLVSVPFDTTQAPVSATGTPDGEVSGVSIECR